MVDSRTPTLRFGTRHEPLDARKVDAVMVEKSTTRPNTRCAADKNTFAFEISGRHDAGGAVNEDIRQPKLAVWKCRNRNVRVPARSFRLHQSAEACIHASIYSVPRKLLTCKS